MEFIKFWSDGWAVSFGAGIFFFIIEYNNPTNYSLLLAISLSLIGVLQLITKLIRLRN